MADRADSVTGVLRIEIPNPAASVTLTFEATSDGDRWDPDRVADALYERGIENPPKETIAAFLQKAGSRKGPVSETVIEGTEPTPPKSERVEWSEELTMPERFTSIYRTVIAESPPQIFREITEKVPKQKQVAKKGLLGLGQAKTESVTVEETRTRRERVYIDPTAEHVYYVEPDRVLGEVHDAQSGASGEDVFGKPIPTKQLADPRFYPGSGIVRRGNTLVAETQGFLRIGKNWADIVEFYPHRWSVHLSEDHATCYMSVTPGHPASAPPTGADVLHAATQLPYPEDSLMSADEIDDLVRAQLETGEEATLPISSSRDASFDIVVSQDKLEALLYIHKGKGRGNTLNLKEIGAAIKASKLKGLDFKKIGEDIKAFYNSNEFDLTGYVLAEGSAPTPGPDRAVEFSLRFDKEKKTDQYREILANADEAYSPESLSEFPPESIQKTAPVEDEQLVATIDPNTPGEPGTDVYGQPIPAPAGAEPRLRLFENLRRDGDIVATTERGILDYAEIDGAYYLRVREHADAKIEVELSHDRMSATLSLVEGAGTGTRLSTERVEQQLSAAGVSYGIDEEVLEKSIAAAQAGTEVRRVVVAKGREPVAQSENRLELLVGLEEGEKVRIRKDGTADYRTQNTIPTVNAGQTVCKILPPQQAPVDGITVRGETVPAKKVSNLDIELGDNVRREDKDDGSALIIAETDGEFHRVKNKVEVRTAHTIKGDVDMSVGNVKFPGSVAIGGTVRAGFYVMSGGDIKIAGGVESALLSSEGDVRIKQGIKGAGKAVIRSKGAILSPFVELATLLSVGDIRLKSAIVRCRIKCNGKISFAGPGRIMGGTIRARHGIEVQTIGSPRGIKTRISFGQDYLIADLIEKEEKEIDKVKTRLTQLDLDMRKAEKAKQDETLKALRQEKVKMLKLMEKRGLRLFTLRERFEQHFPSKIVVRGEVFPGTEFESHGRTYEVTTPRKGIVVEFDPRTGNIGMREIDESDQ